MKNGFVSLLVIVIAFVSLVSLAPRTIFAGDPSTDTGVEGRNSTHNLEAAATEANQASLLKAVPLPPVAIDSQERRNLNERLERLRDPNRIGYVALIGPQGQLVAYYTVKGKVSSLNSYLTTTMSIHCKYSNGASCVTVDSPDLDGSYGKNPEGIFFFTTAGVMVEWSGAYLSSDQPLSYAQAPLLVQVQK